MEAFPGAPNEGLSGGFCGVFGSGSGIGVVTSLKPANVKFVPAEIYARPSRESTPQDDFTQPGEYFGRRDGLGLARVKARNPAGDLSLLSCFGSRLRLQIHAVEETAGQKKTLIRRQHERFL